LALLFLICAIAFPLLVLFLVWLVRVVASTDVPQDTIGRERSLNSLSWLGRLRIWLTAKPKRLDYRRDKKGRFRRVRRG
jgi:hypothetical protein